MENYFLSGMMGLVVGDALGGPVQFMERDEIRNRPQGPVTTMEPITEILGPGSWSDDSSMAIATLDSLICKGKVDLDNIMLNFVKWLDDGVFTPYGFAWDIGATCEAAIERYKEGFDVYNCGLRGEWNNGNGSLMRIFPVCVAEVLSDNIDLSDVLDVSRLTHAHDTTTQIIERFYRIVKNIIKKKNYGDSHSPKVIVNAYERAYGSRMSGEEPEETISSSGYVVNTFNAAKWCFIGTKSYEECVLKAVNLGDDTDSVAAVAGALAGLYYGYDAIPEEWLQTIPRRDYIEDMCEMAFNVFAAHA